jgi:hypothetical protein
LGRATAIELKDAAADELPAGEVEVLVNARTPAEFTAVNDLLLGLQTQQVENNAAYVARVAEADGGEMHQLEVPRSEVGTLVAQLEDRAPRNVQVLQLTEMAENTAPAAHHDAALRGGVAAARRPADGRAPAQADETERAKKESKTATAPRARGSADSAERTQSTMREYGQQQMARGGRGGRIVYRAPNRQLMQQRGAGNDLAATQPGEADETVVVNVLVAPPGSPQQLPVQSQSQPASRSVP